MTALQFSKVVVLVYNPTTMYESSYSSIPLVALGIIRLFNFSQYGISFKNILSWDNFKLREKLREQYTKLPYSLYLYFLIFNILPYFSFPLMYMMILSLRTSCKHNDPSLKYHSAFPPSKSTFIYNHTITIQNQKINIDTTLLFNPETLLKFWQLSHSLPLFCGLESNPVSCCI